MDTELLAPPPNAAPTEAAQLAAQRWHAVVIRADIYKFLLAGAKQTISSWRSAFAIV